MSAITARSTARRSSLARWLQQDNRGWLAIGYVILIAAIVWTVLPIYWVVVSSLKPDNLFYDSSTVLWTPVFTVQHYADMLFNSGFPINLRNSFVVAAGTALLSTVVGSMAGYALVRLRFVGRNVFARLLIYCYL